MAAEGFHEGELAVQSRAGVRAQAARLGGTMLAVPDLNGGISGFLAERDFAVLTARDADGRLWTSALIASAGFLEARDRELTVHAAPGSGDALHGLAEGQAVGLLAIEFATRRRVRVNGTLTYAGTDELQIVVDQAFGNCPKYIQQRRLVHTESSEPATERLVRSATLGDEDVALMPAPTPSSSAPSIRRAAPTHPTAGEPLASSASKASGCGGRITPATTCSTVSGTSRWTVRRPCCSSTSSPAPACRSRARRRSNG
jgi:hypothetical protein